MGDVSDKRIVELLEALVKIEINEVITEKISDPLVNEVYELTGEKNTKEISKSIGISTGKVSMIWKDLEKRGLILKDGREYKKVF